MAQTAGPTVAANPRANAIYVANNGDNTVAVISGKTSTVTATIPVGNSPQGGRGQSEDRHYLHH